jgi:hypothetical protein
VVRDVSRELERERESDSAWKKQVKDRSKAVET